MSWEPCGGLRFDGGTSNVRIARDPAFDLDGAWTVEAVVDGVDGVLDGPVVDRSVARIGCDVDFWLLLAVGHRLYEDGQLHCIAGLTPDNNPEARSAPGTISSRESTRITCHRDALGEMAVGANGEDVTDWVSPGPSNVRVGEDADFRIGAHSRCGETLYYTGVVRALAVHAD